MQAGVTRRWCSTTDSHVLATGSAQSHGTRAMQECACIHPIHLRASARTCTHDSRVDSECAACVPVCSVARAFGRHSSTSHSSRVSRESHKRLCDRERAGVLMPLGTRAFGRHSSLVRSAMPMDTSRMTQSAMSSSAHHMAQNSCRAHWGSCSRCTTFLARSRVHED